MAEVFRSASQNSCRPQRCVLGLLVQLLAAGSSPPLLPADTVSADRLPGSALMSSAGGLQQSAPCLHGALWHCFQILNSEIIHPSRVRRIGGSLPCRSFCREAAVGHAVESVSQEALTRNRRFLRLTSPGFQRSNQKCRRDSCRHTARRCRFRCRRCFRCCRSAAAPVSAGDPRARCPTSGSA